MRLKIILTLLISAFFLISCNSGSSKPSSDVGGGKLKEIGIAEYDALKKEHGDKIILMNFFASWCPPCRQETPDFIKVYEKYKDKGFIIIGLSMDDDIDKAVEFVKGHKIPYPVYHASRELEAKMNVTSMPTNVFYSKGGNLYNFFVGALTLEFVENVIADIQKESQK